MGNFWETLSGLSKRNIIMKSFDRDYYFVAYVLNESTWICIGENNGKKYLAKRLYKKGKMKQY